MVKVYLINIFLMTKWQSTSFEVYDHIIMIIIIIIDVYVTIADC